MINIKKIFKKTLIVLSLFLLSSTNVFAAPNEVDFKINLNGENLKLETPVLEENSRTLVPLRLVAENLGYKVKWIEETRQVNVINETDKLIFTVDSNIISINDVSKEIDVPTRIYKDRAYIPIRSLENLNSFIDWDESSRTVIVKKNSEIHEKIERKKPTDKTSFEYWDYYNNYSDELIMSPEEIQIFNDEISIEKNKMANISKVDETYDRSFLLSELIRLSKFENSRYDSKKKVLSDAYKNNLVENMNIDEFSSSPLKHGIINKRIIMRSYPTNEPFYKSSYGTLDYAVETAIYPWEEIAIYNVSKDGRWYFGQIFNAYGWVPTESVSFGSKEEINRYTKSDEFLVVTDDKVNVGGLQLDMGVRLPLVSESENSYTVYLPETSENINVKEVEIEKSAVNKGYLPFTEKNMIRQALKFYGEVYGWGGLKNTRDCSGLILDVYRSMGIKIPRNSGDQGKSEFGKTFSLKGLDKSKRFEALKVFGPGTSIQMEGHVMMYLGTDENGVPKVIHQYLGHYQNGKYIPMNKASITSLEIKGSNGKTFIMNSYGLKFFKY